MEAKTLLDLQEGGFIRDFQDDDVRVVGERRSGGKGPRAGGLSCCVCHLRRDPTEPEISSDDEKVVQ